MWSWGALHRSRLSRLHDGPTRDRAGRNRMTRKQDLQDRLQRAQSWIKAAEGISSGQNHERFMFYYVALEGVAFRNQGSPRRSRLGAGLVRADGHLRSWR
jgi:hypothetical protein